jgi:hypothetical protein
VLSAGCRSEPEKLESKKWNLMDYLNEIEASRLHEKYRGISFYRSPRGEKGSYTLYLWNTPERISVNLKLDSNYNFEIESTQKFTEWDNSKETYMLAEEKLKEVTADCRRFRLEAFSDYRYPDYNHSFTIFFLMKNVDINTLPEQVSHLRDKLNDSTKAELIYSRSGPMLPEYPKFQNLFPLKERWFFSYEEQIIIPAKEAIDTVEGL